MRSVALGLGLLVVAACSPVRIGGDGAVMDADDVQIDGEVGIDAQVDATPFGEVTVKVLDDVTMAPVVGAKVRFSNPDGTEISTTVTNEGGAASAEVPFGAVVTVGYSRPNPDSDAGTLRMVQTVFAVHPGDVIEIGPRRPEPTGDPVAQWQLKAPVAVDTASSYSVGTECNSTALSPFESWTYYHRDDRCTHGKLPLDLLGVAWDSSDAPMVYTTFLGLTAATTGDQIGTNWQVFSSLNLTATNSPLGGFVSLRARLLRGGVDYDFNRTESELPISVGGGAERSLYYPPGFIDKQQVTFQLFDSGQTDMRMYLRNLPADATSHSLDLGDMLPGVGGVAVADSDLSRPGMTWQSSPGLVESTVGMLGFAQWSRDQDVWVWQFLAPPDAEAPLQLPFMPGDLVDVWPIPSNSTLTGYVVGYLRGGGFANWDEFRQNRGLGVMGEDDVIIPPDAPAGAEAWISAGGLFGFN